MVYNTGARDIPYYLKLWRHFLIIRIPAVVQGNRGKKITLALASVAFLPVFTAYLEVKFYFVDAGCRFIRVSP